MLSPNLPKNPKWMGVVVDPTFVSEFSKNDKIPNSICLAGVGVIDPTCVSEFKNDKIANSLVEERGHFGF